MVKNELQGMGGGPSQNTAIGYSPMNGDVSATQAVTLIVEAPQGYINGTVSSGGVNMSGVTVTAGGASDVTDPAGRYSIELPEGTYDLTASKQPTHSDNTITGIAVAPGNTTTADITLVAKPTGNISGTITA